MVAYLRGLPLGGVTACRPSGLEKVVDEHYAMRNDTTLTNCDQLANESVRLNAAVATYSHVFLYLNKGTDEAIVSYFATVEVDRLDDRDVSAEGDVPDADDLAFWLHCSSPAP